MVKSWDELVMGGADKRSSADACMTIKFGKRLLVENGYRVRWQRDAEQLVLRITRKRVFPQTHSLFRALVAQGTKSGAI
jgi:hypothetical protein